MTFNPDALRKEFADYCADVEPGIKAKAPRLNQLETLALIGMTLFQAAKELKAEKAELADRIDALESAAKADEDDDVTVAQMGHGSVSVGGCFSPEVNAPGIIYMALDEPREIGADTTDVYTVGTRAKNVLAFVTFANAAAVDQTIGILQELKAQYFATAPAAIDNGGGRDARNLTAKQKWDIAERVHAQCEALKPNATFRSAASQAINDTIAALSQKAGEQG